MCPEYLLTASRRFLLHHLPFSDEQGHMCHVDISDCFRKFDGIQVLIFAVILDLMTAAKLNILVASVARIVSGVRFPHLFPTY
jgi:hypothetical protein